MKSYKWNGHKVYLAREIEELWETPIYWTTQMRNGSRFKGSFIEGKTHYILTGSDVKRFSQLNAISFKKWTTTMTVFTEYGYELLKELKPNKGKSDLNDITQSNPINDITRFMENEFNKLVVNKDEEISRLKHKNENLMKELQGYKQKVKDLKEDTIQEVSNVIARLIFKEMENKNEYEGHSFRMDKNGNLERIKQ